ncbi:hypothetical protein MMC14_000713 [Varicellaria rhodocarpa]|nr:hypothetical protein [Varicellaria rhodocarpa]
MTSPLPSFLLEDLGNLALSSPSSLIPANRHVLQARVSPTTKERLYMTEVSLPLSGLVAKTLTKHPTLSLYGAQILIDGPRNLLNRATEVIGDQKESRARNVAYRMLQSAKTKMDQSPGGRTASASYQVQATAAPTRTLFNTSILFPRERAAASPPSRARTMQYVASDVVADTFCLQYTEDEDSLAGLERAGLMAKYGRLEREGTMTEAFQ